MGQVGVGGVTWASWYWRAGRVEMVIPTMETDTKMVERTEMTWAALLVSGFSITSHIIFWYLANLPVPKSSSSS